MISSITQFFAGLVLTIFTACFSERVPTKPRIIIYLTIGALLLVTGSYSIYQDQKERHELIYKNTKSLHHINTLLTQIHWKKLKPELNLMALANKLPKLKKHSANFKYC